MGNAAIYARVSSARQKDQETLGSQTATPHAEELGLDVPPASTPPGPQFGLAHLVAHPRAAGSSVGRIRVSAVRSASPASATRPCLPYTSPQPGTRPRLTASGPRWIRSRSGAPYRASSSLDSDVLSATVIGRSPIRPFPPPPGTVS
jgi:hypothetical protein